MKAARLFPLAGIAAVALFVIAFAVGGESPGTDDSIRKIVSFYRDNDSDQVWAAALLTWGTAFFLLFSSGLWRFLRNADPERRGGSTLVVVGSTVFAVGATIFAGISFTLGDAADDMGPAAIQALNALNSDMFFTVALGTFTFLIGAGASVVQTGALPKWIGWVAMVIAVVALTPLGFFAFLVMLVWLLIVSVLVYLRQSATPAPEAP
jgi:hypothetical protein